MKQQHTLHPKLRFPEFERGWKIEQIGNIADIYDGTHQTPKYVSQGVPFVSVENINNIENSDKFITKEAFNNYKIKPRTGDILMTRITAGIIGATSIVKNDLDLAYYVSLALIRNKSENNIEFINHYISTDYFKRELHKRIIHVAFPKKINLGDINQCILKYSDSINEQQKIADYLSTVDNKINLLEEKKSQLALYKKAMMQKLFSQEIRFKPSEAEALEAYPEWEEKRLGEIGFFQTSSIDKLSRENEKEVFLINYMNVYRHEKIDKLSIVNYQKVTAKDAQIISCNIKKGDILFTPSSETPSDIGHSVVIFEDIENAVFSYHLMRFRPNIKLDLKYSHYFCNIPKVLNQLSKYATGSTRFTISVKSFANVIVDIPCYEEQQKIADFLSAIDESIEKVTEQISQTQSFKKAMLQGMFV